MVQLQNQPTVSDILHPDPHIGNDHSPPNQSKILIAQRGKACIACFHGCHVVYVPATKGLFRFSSPTVVSGPCPDSKRVTSGIVKTCVLILSSNCSQLPPG